MISFEPRFSVLPLSSVYFLAACTWVFALNAAGLPTVFTLATEPELRASVMCTPAGALAAGPTGAIGRNTAVFFTVNARGALQPCFVHLTETFDPFGALTTSFTAVTLPAAFDFQVSTASASSFGGFW